MQHRLTRNLWRLVIAEERKQWSTELAYPVWNARLDAVALARNAKMQEKSREKMLKTRAMENKGHALLTEVIALAEAKDKLTLGRVMLKRKVRRFVA